MLSPMHQMALRSQSARYLPSPTGVPVYGTIPGTVYLLHKHIGNRPHLNEDLLYPKQTLKLRGSAAKTDPKDAVVAIE